LRSPTTITRTELRELLELALDPKAWWDVYSIPKERRWKSLLSVLRNRGDIQVRAKRESRLKRK